MLGNTVLPTKQPHSLTSRWTRKVYTSKSGYCLLYTK